MAQQSILLHAGRLACSLLLALAHADEGMWTFDQPPLNRLAQDYGFRPTPTWLSHLQQSAAYFNGSASFVSKDGLLLTNHHVAMGCISKLSSPGKDWSSEGYLARNRRQELSCPGAFVLSLDTSSDVTEVVQAAALPEQQGTASQAKQQVIAKLESDCRVQSGQPCKVNALYGGARYYLYRYRAWDDVRLVFAPEFQAAFFGGDSDNFTYPRHVIDFALLRVYQRGRPLQPTHFLKLAQKPLAEGDLVMVAGFPQPTERQLSKAQLIAARDATLPLNIAGLQLQQQLLHRYAEQSAEAANQASEFLYLVENDLKASQGELASLKDPALLAHKEEEEARFRADYQQRGLPGDPWAELAVAAARQTSRAKELRAIRYGRQTLGDYAGRLVEQAYERQLPETERLVEYLNTALPAIERLLITEKPFYPQLESALLFGYLQEAEKLLGRDHPFVSSLLAGETAEVIARRTMASTRLGSAAERLKLIKGGTAAIEASDDPLVQLARKIYPLRRELMRYQELQINTPARQASEMLGQARFALYGNAAPPDATGTLRLSYGTIAGYQDGDRQLSWRTTYGELYARAEQANQQFPLNLAPKIARARANVEPDMPLNFVSTVDTLGGNSGSPLVNTEGDWVGLIFDGNAQSFGGRYAYGNPAARAIAVDARAILHALERIYGAPELAKELRGGK